MKPSVYLDSTIPSYRYENRTNPISRAWHEITVQFWDVAPQRFELFISDEVLLELSEENYPEEKRRQCLKLIAPIECLRIVPQVTDLAMYYVKEGLMPSRDFGDAYHLAYASWYRVQYLVTWNCKHWPTLTSTSTLLCSTTEKGWFLP